MGVVDILRSEVKSKHRELLHGVGEPGLLDTSTKCVEGDLAAQLLHDECDLPDIHALAADRAHEKLPVRCFQLRGRECDGHYIDAGVLGAAFFDLGRRGQNYHVLQRLGRGTVVSQ